MLETLQLILEQAVGHLRYEMTTYLPPILAALTILLVAYICALVARWVLNHLFKGNGFDRWLSRSGFTSVIHSSADRRPSRIVGRVAYWAILILGLITALNAINTRLTSAIADMLIYSAPKLGVAGAVLFGGIWLAQYLGRGMLVWAVNEELPAPRRLALGVRALVMFAAVVAAADYLNFARGVFLAAFILMLSGVVLVAALAVGLGGREAVRRYLHERSQNEDSESIERSVLRHL